MTPDTRTYRTAIIGGGIMGAAALYHLAKNGWTDTILLEKAELTSGSTWHAAGQIAHAVGSRVMGWINKTSIETYLAAEAECGHSVGWHPVGGFRVAYTDDEVDWMRSILNTGLHLDLPMDLVGPEEIARVNPFYRTDGIKAAVRTYTDGHVDPSGATQALAAAARRLGATVERHCRVTDAARRGDAWLLTTENGAVLCDHVIIAAGSYARQVGAWFGLDIPSLSLLHHYLVTDTVPEFVDRAVELPVMRDNSYGGYIRQEQKSGLIGVFESENAPVVWADGVPWESENELFEADYEAIGHYLERAFDRMPVFAERGIKRVVRGAIPHTPDGGMLVGPAPGGRNVWLACGLSIGLAWAGGAGKCLADLMVHGEAAVSTRSLDPRRYGDFCTADYNLLKSREDFEIRHDTPVPGQQRPAGRPWIRHPIYEALAARGAVFGEVSGWERPRWFADRPGTEDRNGWRRQSWHAEVGAECRAVRDQAGLLDLSAFSQFELSGADAKRLLDRLSANRIPQSIGRIALCHLLTPKGNFETEVTVCRLADDRFFIGCAIAGRHRDRDWLTAHIAEGEDVTLADRSSDWGLLALSGPCARDIMATGTDADLSNAGFPWLTGQEVILFGVPVIALRVSFSGELGWEFHTALENLPALYEGLHRTGRSFGLRDYGGHALNSLRLEKAYHGSAELTPDVGLAEAGMLRFFRPDGREFIGRDATLRRIESGPAWRSVYLDVDARDADCLGGEAILLNGRRVGMTTSGGYGHRTERSLAFGYIEAGTPSEGLSVFLLGEERPVTVLQAPVYDPENKRPRG